MTAFEHRMLIYIRATIEERGYAPSYREIAKHLGHKSNSSGHAAVQSLVRAGYLVKHKSSNRQNLALPTPTLANVPTSALHAEIERRGASS